MLLVVALLQALAEAVKNIPVAEEEVKLTRVVVPTGESVAAGSWDSIVKTDEVALNTILCGAEIIFMLVTAACAKKGRKKTASPPRKTIFLVVIYFCFFLNYVLLVFL